MRTHTPKAPRGRATTQADRWKRRRARDTIARARHRFADLFGEPKPFEWQVHLWLASERMAMSHVPASIIGPIIRTDID